MLCCLWNTGTTLLLHIRFLIEITKSAAITFMLLTTWSSHILLHLSVPLNYLPLASLRISFFISCLCNSAESPPLWYYYYYLFIYFLWLYSSVWAMASVFWRFRDHTRRATVGRTPLDEWLARCRDLYLTTHTTDKHPCPRWDSNPRSQQASWVVDLRLIVCSHWDQPLCDI
jgi:hypothetical protein